MSELELRHLAALRAVAHEGSFGRAASELGYTQSAVSQQIAALERAVGALVFERLGGRRSVELTPAGRLLLEHAEDILDRVQRASDALFRFREGTAGPLTVGTFQSVSATILPEVLGLLRSERPEIDIHLVEVDDPGQLQERTANGEIDVTFLTAWEPDDRLHISELCQDPFVVLAPSGSTGSTRSIRLDELTGSALIGQGDSTCQVALDRHLARAGLVPSYLYRSNDNGAVRAMVRAGMGYAILPRLAIDTHDPGVRVLDLDPPLPPRRIAVAVRADRALTPSARRFVELARLVCATNDRTPASAPPEPATVEATTRPRSGSEPLPEATATNT